MMMMMMRKKKRDYNDDYENLVYSKFSFLLFQHSGRRVFPLLCAAFASFTILFLFSLLFSPPVVHQPHLRQQLRITNDMALESKLDAEVVFRVPEFGATVGRDLWDSGQSKFYYGCSNASYNSQLVDEKTQRNRYLVIATSGGLNQQRTGIIDSVVAAYILNATLVVPKLDQRSYWKDSSKFDEIFDVELFISSLSKDVKIIKELPRKNGKVIIPHSMRVPRKCSRECYLTRVLPAFKKKNILQLSKFDYRLANTLDPDLQKLRCRVNYHALKFADPIRQMGKLLMERMRMKSKLFVALHLRFEPDMLAFSGCYYGGGKKERSELKKIRKRWRNLHKPNPEKVRRQGRCPLTPEEIGLMLRALGYGSDVHLYVASGNVYGGEETLAPLKALFPNYHTKETIASKDELAPFSPYSSRMAALDFIVCDESDVFVSNNNGNMAKILAGRRKYFGHKVSIRPNAKKLNKLFLNRKNTTWEEFASKVQSKQIGFMGEPNGMKPGSGAFHENPSSCICEHPQMTPKVVSKLQVSYANNNHGKGNAQYTSNDDVDDEYWSDADDNDDGDMGLGWSAHGNPFQPEVEEYFSD